MPPFKQELTQRGKDPGTVLNTQRLPRACTAGQNILNEENDVLFTSFIVSLSKISAKQFVLTLIFFQMFYY